MHQKRLFNLGSWAPLWALVASAAIGGGVIGTALVIERLPGALEQASSKVNSTLTAAGIARGAR